MWSLPWGSTPRYNSDPATCTHKYTHNDINIQQMRRNTNVDTSNFKNPVTLYMDKYASVSPHTTQGWKGELGLGSLQISTDRGSVLSNFEDEEYIKADAYEQYPYPIVANPFFTPAWYNFTVNPRNTVTKIVRKYVSLMDVLAQVGGVMANLTQFFTLGYFFYNYYRRSEEIIKNDILVNEDMYTDEYKFSGHFASMYWRSMCCSKRTKFKNAQEEKREQNFRACNDIMNQAMDIENYMRDSIELQLLKGLFIKERHRILMPILAMSTAKRKLELKDKLIADGKKVNQVGADNIYDLSGKVEKISVDEAVGQLKMGLHKSDYEKMVDHFFLENLPTSAYRGKRSMVSHMARGDERDSLRSEMVSDSVSGFGGSTLSRNVQSKSSVVQKRASVLKDMIDSAIFETDQVM